MLENLATVILLGSGRADLEAGPELATLAAVATRALVRRGHRVIALDPNPNALATELATVAYAEPVDARVLAALAAEEPGAALVLPTFGGAAALAACASLEDRHLAPGARVAVAGLRAARDLAASPEAARASVATSGRAVAPSALPAGRVELELVRDAAGETLVIAAIGHDAAEGVHAANAGSALLDVPAWAREAARELASHFGLVGAAGLVFAAGSGSGSSTPAFAALRLGASATTAFVERVTGFPCAETAARAALGEALASIAASRGLARLEAPSGIGAGAGARTEPIFAWDAYPRASRDLGAAPKSFARVLRAPGHARIHATAAAAMPDARRALVFVGAGATRPGHGPSLDASAARAALAARATGARALVIDANVASAAAAFADEAFALAATADAVAEVARAAAAAGAVTVAAVLQFGGEAALDLAEPLEAAGVALAGTTARAVRAARAMRRDRGAPELRTAAKLRVECLVDGARAALAAVFEYVEPASIHPSDSAALLPVCSLDVERVHRAEEAARAAALGLGALGVRGLVSVEVALVGDAAVVIDARAGAGDELPFASKALGRDLAGQALALALGATLDELGLGDVETPAHVAARECSFPFAVLEGSTPGLGAEARATGEAMGVGATLAGAYAKALEAVGVRVARPLEDAHAPGPRGALLVTSAEDCEAGVLVARRLRALGFDLRAGAALAALLEAMRVPHERVTLEAALAAVESGDVAVVIATTPTADDAASTRALRAHALARGVPCITTLVLAQALASTLEAEGAITRVRAL